MALKEDLTSEVNQILNVQWNARDGRVVPDSLTVGLNGGAVRIDAVILYTDLAESTKIAKDFDSRIAAKVFKSFLTCSSRIIRASGGVVKSFDGDRVMGVFIKGQKNTDAVKAAMKIKYAFEAIIKSKLLSKYPQLVGRLDFGTGIDSSKILVVKGGIINSNDLVWVGTAPNIAAKLSSVRTPPYNTYITERVYKNMLDSVRYHSSSGDNMWEYIDTSDSDLGESIVYRSSFRMTL
jgi:class 3 adenylate cyclase